MVCEPNCRTNVLREINSVKSKAYRLEGNHKEALKYAKIAFDLAVTRNSERDIIEMGDMLILSYVPFHGSDTSGVNNLVQYLLTFSDSKFKNSIASFYNNLADYYASHGQPDKSMIYKKKYRELMQEMFDESLVKTFRDEMEMDIVSGDNEFQSKNSTIRKQQFLIVALAVLILLLGSYFIYYVKFKD